MDLPARLRSYREHIDVLLTWLANGERSESEFDAEFRERPFPLVYLAAHTPILGSMNQHGPWPKWLDLLQILCGEGICRTASKDGKVVYSLAAAT